jgi:inward rectifier potassium channel
MEARFARRPGKDKMCFHATSMAERLIEQPNLPPTLIRGVNWKPHEDLYHFILTRTWWQYFGILGLVFFGINAVFGVLYWLNPGCVSGANDFQHSFFFSIETLATIGYGSMAPATYYGHIVASFEAFLGMLFVAVVTGLTFAKFSRPTARVLFSRFIVVHERDGVPHLVFRLANQRHNLVVEAQLRVVLLTLHVTKEGEVMRRASDLPLVRDRTSIFTLTWIPMHRIDSESLFHGPNAMQRLKDLRAEFFLSLQAYDETLAQTVHARWRYTLDDIKWDTRFADVMEITDDGTRIIDYSKFHAIEPMTKAE